MAYDVRLDPELKPGLDGPGELRIGFNSDRIVLGQNRAIVVDNTATEGQPTAVTNGTRLSSDRAAFCTSEEDFILGVNLGQGNEYTLPSDLYCRSLEIPEGCKLNTNGFRIFVGDSLDVAGHIACDGGPGGDGAGGEGGAGGTSPEGTLGVSAPGGAGGAGEFGNPGGRSINALGGSGGLGGDNHRMINNNVGGRALVVFDAPPIPTRDGGVELIGNVLSLLSGRDLRKNRITGGSGGYGGDGAGINLGINVGGGGGGGGGGVIMISAQSMILRATGIISAVGGNGGNAEDKNGEHVAGGGGGGGGGAVILIFRNAVGIERSRIMVQGGKGGDASSGEEILNPAEDGRPGRIVLQLA